MSVKKLFIPACVASAGLVVVVGSIAIADTSADPAAAAFQLPAGWTEADMQACMLAGTPGDQHKRLAKGIGEWAAETTMWMTADSEPMKSEGTSTVESFMDGRYLKVEMEGEIPGMGPFRGFGLYGFDNLAQQYVSMWVDNHNTQIMRGTGEASDDGKVLTWTYEVNCPVAKKLVTMRDVETTIGPDSKTLETYSVDPKSGKEFKMMHIDLTRK